MTLGLCLKSNVSTNFFSYKLQSQYDSHDDVTVPVSVTKEQLMFVITWFLCLNWHVMNIIMDG